MIKDSEAQPCPDLVINGVENFAWKHRLPAPFMSYTNTDEVIRFLNSGGSKAVVSMDGVCLQDVETWIMVAGIEGAFSEDTVKFLDDFSQKGHMLLMSDFSSQAGKSINEGVNNRNKLVALGGAAVVALASLRSKNRTLTRREFLKSGSLAFAALALSNISINLAADYATNTANSCDLDNPFNYANAIVNDAAIPDLVARTGIVIAKQSRMRDTRFMGEEFDNHPHKSIWGTSHLQNFHIVKQIEAVAQDPRPVADAVFQREITHLRDNLKLPSSEVLEIASSLRVNMAGVLPLKVSKLNGGYDFMPINQQEPIFFDERILGFNAKNMRLQDVVYKTKEMALKIWLS